MESVTEGETMAGKSAPEQPKKDQSLTNTIEQIERQFGKGAIMRLGDDVEVDVTGIKTGAFSLDMALGGRGIPKGRIVEVYGPESSGKTTLALHVIANAQRDGGIAAFVDAEHALDPSYARRLGVNLDDLLVSQPDTGEQALEIVEMLVRSNALELVVVDSVAALVPRAEIEGEMGDAHVGLQARLMSQALRKLTAAIAKTQTTVLFINQIREKIGVFFGNPEVTPGGRALKFYSSVRLDIRRIGALKTADEVIGNRVRVTVVKNKVAPPFRKAEFDVLFNKGISRIGDILDLSVEKKIVQKSGAWYSYGDVRLGQGRDRTVEFLEENKNLHDEIEAKLIAAYKKKKDEEDSRLKERADIASQQTAKASQQTAKASQQTAKASQQTAKASQQTAKASQQTAKTAQTKPAPGTPKENPAPKTRSAQ